MNIFDPEITSSKRANIKEIIKTSKKLKENPLVNILINTTPEMSESVKCQVFNRGFTTKKERGRGLGTYSIKLLTERYLNGKVNFTSAENETVFTIRL